MDKEFIFFLLKNLVLLFFAFFCISGIIFFSVQLEKSNIEDIRYCPHCGAHLIK